MSIIKHKIQISNDDINIKVGIKNLSDVYGYDQDLNKFTKEEVSKILNPIKDKEVLRFVCDVGVGDNLIFRPEFAYEDEIELTGSTGTTTTVYYDVGYTSAGFTISEIRNYMLNFRKSFFIFEFFDGYKTNTRTRIFTKYYSKLWDLGKELVNYENPKMNINPELKYLDIPRVFLEKQDEEFYLYVRIMFYNAKTGNLVLFYNEDNENVNEEIRNFFKVIVNKTTKTWDSDGGDFLAKQQIAGQEYLNKINATNKRNKDLQSDYPSGVAFKYIDGTYDDDIN